MSSDGKVSAGKNRVKQKQTSPSRVGNVTQHDRIVSISDYLKRRERSLLTKNMDTKLRRSVDEGLEVYRKKIAKNTLDFMRTPLPCRSRLESQR